MLKTETNPAHGRAIVNNSASPHVRLSNLAFGDCRWTDGFWGDKTRLAEEVMVPHMGELLKGDIGHAYNNFKIAAGLTEGEARGMLWHDGDFYKWMEATAYIYALNQDERLLTELDEIIAVIAQAQQEDGYLHTHAQINRLERWSEVTNHELYNSGHLITGACIHHRLTGKTNWLDIAVKHADYLYSVFVPVQTGLERFGFNPSQIMGLVELYRTTGERRYLELAETFVDMRGSTPVEQHPSVPYWFTGAQCQNKTPLREETEAVGHAVTAFYLYCGAADVYAETGDSALIDALERIWGSAFEKRMYLTGAFGQVHHGAYDDQNMVHEGFVDDYLMPNSTAYNETCANIAGAMFNWRMLSLTSDAKHADLMELALYNSALVGISTDGKRYFYANPLRMNHGQREYSDEADCTESADREPYIECFCCPPNLVRTIAQLSGWAYSLSDAGVAVNLYGGNQLDTTQKDGTTLRLRQETNYPWDGRIEITIEECKTDPFEVALRIPGWADEARVQINGQDAEIEVTPGVYARIERTWASGDVITVDLPMEAKLIEGHPRIEEVRNQVALKRGPLVYCIESPDLPEGVSTLDVYLNGDAPLKVEHQPDFLGGVSTIETEVLLRSDDHHTMYQEVKRPSWESVPTRFVPYFAWSNRGTAEMTVFVPVVWA